MKNIFIFEMTMKNIYYILIVLIKPYITFI